MAATRAARLATQMTSATRTRASRGLASGATGVVGIREPPGLLAPAEPPGQAGGSGGAGLAGVVGAHQPCGAVHLHQFGAGGRACVPPVVVAGQGAEPPDGPAVGAGVVPEGGAGDGAERGRVERAHLVTTSCGLVVQVWAAMILAASAGVKVTAMVASQRSHTTATPTLKGTAYR